MINKYEEMCVPTEPQPDYDYLLELTEEELEEYYIEEYRVQFRREWYEYTRDWD